MSVTWCASVRTCVHVSMCVVWFTLVIVVCLMRGVAGGEGMLSVVSPAHIGACNLVWVHSCVCVHVSVCVLCSFCGLFQGWVGGLS